MVSPKFVKKGKAIIKVVELRLLKKRLVIKVNGLKERRIMSEYRFETKKMNEE